MRQLALVGIAALALAGCGSASAPTAASEESTATESPAVEATAEPAAAEETGRIVKSGFGQEDEFVWVTAIVENLTDKVGQTVTVSFNLLDADGQILKTETQVEGFVVPTAEHIIGTQAMLADGQTVADLEVALQIEDDNLFGTTPFTALTMSDTQVGPDSFGGASASLELTNETSENVTDARVQTACFDVDGTIVGGGSEYPDLVPADGRIKVDVYLLLSEEPDSCTSFVGNLGDSWEPGAAEGGQTQAGSAGEALETWVEQFNAKAWTAHYATLVNAQRDIITEEEYVRCRESEETPTFGWIGVIDETEIENYFVPGAAGTVRATKVTVHVEFEGVTVPIDAHMVDEDGVWKWSMTTENLNGCMN